MSVHCVRTYPRIPFTEVHLMPVMAMSASHRFSL
jgi:hypothetical protein